MRAKPIKANTNCRQITESTLNLIERAKRELRKCEGCTGAPCQKPAAESVNRYYQPVFCGEEVSWAPCKYYVEPIKLKKPKPTAEEKPLILADELFRGMSVREALKQIRARQEALKPAYCAKYGLKDLTTQQVGQLQNAEIRLNECNRCNGCYCNKATEKYQQPQITVNSGTVEIEMALCDVWRAQAYKEQCAKAGVPRKYIGKTFDDYEITADNKQAVSQARWFIRAPRDRGLYIYGGAGTGKTFLASLIASENVIRGKALTFGDVPELLNRIKQTFDDPTRRGEQILDRYCTTPLLILDDFGAGQITEWAVGVLYQVINERYNAGRQVIVTSNYDLKGLRKRLSKHDNFGGTRIVSRLEEMCYQAFLGTADRRR